MKYHPPKIPLRFLRWFCDPRLQKYIEGDLMELFQENIEEKGVRGARWKFFWDVLRLFRPGIIRSFAGAYRLNSYFMFRNYIKVGFRNILKYKAFSFINIFGLAVAMSVSLLLILMVVDQKEYDQFHTKKDRIYRLLTWPVGNSNPYATSPLPLYETLKEDYPGIEEVTYLKMGFGGDVIYGEHYSEVKGFFTDATFFNVFDFQLAQGDPQTALTEPNNLVITHKVAHLLFGEDNPIGKTVDFYDRGLNFWTDETRSPVEWGTYKITGVLTENEHKSHLEFDVLVSGSTLPQLYQAGNIEDQSKNWSIYWSNYTYALLDDQATQDDLETALSQITDLQYKDEEGKITANLSSQPLKELTPGPAYGNEPSMRLPLFAYYIFGAFALIILLSACLNYTNLSIARILTRSKEIGVRKVNGATRSNVLFQFLSESVLTAFFALVVSNLMLLALKPAFLGLWVNQFLHFDLKVSLSVYLIFFLFALLVGMLAGFFPALKLSGFRPIQALKQKASFTRTKLTMRKTLTVVQLVFSLLFIVTSVVIYQQFRHFMNYEYGFQAEGVINVNLQSNDFDLVKNTFSEVPGISLVSGSAYLPATARNDNMSIKKTDGEEVIDAVKLSVDESFTEVLAIDILAGEALPAGTDQFVLVNEELARQLGYEPAEIVGLTVEGNGERLKVAGVIENFTFSFLFQNQITRPVVLRNVPELLNYANLKIESTDRDEIVQRLEAQWETIDPIHPLKYEFYDDQLAGYNRGIFDLVTIIGFIAFLAITISCLGLLGMAIYITERRTQEVGIRKVLGASGYALAYLLSREFIVLLAVSVVIACPLSYYVNSLWLNFMTVRVDMSIGVVLFGAFVLLLMGIVTIAPQTFIISNKNPVDSLRDE